MATKHSGNSQNYDEIEYAIYCDGLEKQYNQAKDGFFRICGVNRQ